MFLSIVESRYKPDMPKEEKTLCVEALIKKWQIYFYRNYDFATAYENLSKAQEIAEEGSLVMPTINLRLGILYQAISEQSGDQSAAKIAFANYRKGFRDAINIKDTTTLDVFASNLVQLAFITDNFDEIQNDWKRYSALGASHPNMKYRYNLKMYQGLYLLKKKEFDRSISLFDSIESDLQLRNANIRYRFGASLNKAMALTAKRDYEGAVKVLSQQLRIAEAQSIKDVQVEIYKKLSDCYRHMGNAVMAMEYENKALKLNDSLVNFSQLSRLEEVKAGRSIRKYQDRLAYIENQRQIQHIIIVSVAIFLVVVSVLLVVLYRRNRRLNQSNKMLYEKNISQLEEMKARESAPGDEKKIEKYKGSRLEEDEKSALIDKLLAVMNSGDEYLQPDFSIERLAELAGSKSKQVSQVINEKRGCNFNAFLNEFRIHEACRRITDFEQYGNLTLDAISKSVGFRARSSFFTAFKNVTGLTPSEFQKIAKAERNKK